MTTAFLSIKSRPIKLAFLIDPGKKSNLITAINMNTFLWGGQFNPIIPFLSKVPKSWQEPFVKKQNVDYFIKGYIDAYDPDYIITIGDFDFDRSLVNNRKVLTIAEIYEDQVPRYGISIFEVLDYFVHKELKFIRREPINMLLPEIDKRYEAFYAAVFGSLSEKQMSIFRENYSELLHTQFVKCSLINFTELLFPGNLFFRRISNLYIHKQSFQNFTHSNNLFFLNPSSTFDIIDFWNLRAIGWKILPIPIQSLSVEKIKHFLQSEIKKNYHPLPHNSKIFFSTCVLKSRLISLEKIQELLKSLENSSDDNYYTSRCTFQHWYPRIWNDWARDPDNVECCELYEEKKEIEIPAKDESLQSPTLSPKFMKRGEFIEPRYANEISYRLYGNDEIYAEVFPEGGSNLLKATGLFGPTEWRISKSGIVYYANFTNSSILLRPIRANIIFKNWFEHKGWKIEYSSSGLIALQVLKQLGDKYKLSLFAKQGIIELLSRLSGNKTIKEEELWAELSKIANNSSMNGTSEGIFQLLTNQNIIQIGIEIQCPICSQRSWFSLKDINYALECNKCLSEILLNSYSPRNLKWAYRTIGPFNLPYQGYGAYSVLLTLRFFSQLLESRITPLLCFKATKEDIEFEADLSLFIKEGIFGTNKLGLLFAECKTFNDFEKKDVLRMQTISKEFPGSILVFASLKGALSEKEKRILRPFVIKCGKYWENERPKNSVLVLTRNEIYSNTRPPLSWKGLDNEFKMQYEKLGVHLLTLNQLCDVTQQIYLNIPSLQQRWEKEFTQKSKSK